MINRLQFSLADSDVGKNVIIFTSDISSLVHINNNSKDVSVFGKGSTQRLRDTKWTAEAIYPISFTQSGNRFVLSLHYNSSNSCLFANATIIYHFKVKDS